MLSNSTVGLLIGISTFQIVCGFFIGWWLRSTRRAVSNTTQILSQHLTDALGRLQTLADGMGVDASQHAEQVEEIGRRLGSVETGDVDELHRALLDGMSKIALANGRLQAQLVDVESKLGEQARQLENQLAESRLDALTGLANRRAFEDELGRRIAEWQRRPSPLSLLIVDLDHFKHVNDRRGPESGDAVLRDTARLLDATMREMDFTTRFGGDEFAVLLPATSLADARRAAQRVLEAVANHVFHVAGGELRATVSVGLAEIAAGDDAASLLRRADEALYLSKAAGRNCGHFHSGGDFLSLESPRLLDDVATLPPAGDDAASERFEADDPLTNLPAAAAFAHELRHRVQRARTESRALTLVLVDVDRLTQINGHSGRDAGDMVLRRTADVLRGVCKRADYLARYHHGQFALVLADAEADDGVRTAEQIRAAVCAAAFERGYKHVEATLSCGVAALAAGERSVSVVMRAGIALSAAKASGRDCTFVHDGQTAEPADAVRA